MQKKCSFEAQNFLGGEQAPVVLHVENMMAILSQSALMLYHNYGLTFDFVISLEQLLIIYRTCRGTEHVC